MKTPPTKESLIDRIEGQIDVYRTTMQKYGSDPKIHAFYRCVANDLERILQPYKVSQ